jgi:hypothetical protein
MEGNCLGLCAGVRIPHPSETRRAPTAGDRFKISIRTAALPLAL